MQPLDPSPILQLAEVGFELFAKPGTRQLTCGAQGAEIALHPSGIAASFHSFVVMNFGDRIGDGPDAKYANMPADVLHLDSSSPRYNGGMNNRSGSNFPKPFAPANRYSKSAAKNSGGWNSP